MVVKEKFLLYLYGIQQKHIISFFHVIFPKALVTN